MQGGKIPETVMSRKTSDISQFCEHGSYDRAKFGNETVSYPDDNPIIGRYLGHSFDVGPALTAKILKEKG